MGRKKCVSKKEFTTLKNGRFESRARLRPNKHTIKPLKKKKEKENSKHTRLQNPAGIQYLTVIG